MDYVYQKLLEVKIWHDYLLTKDSFPQELPNSYDINDIFEIVPSPITVNLLDAYNLIFKATKTGFMLISEVDESPLGKMHNQTFIRFDERVKLSFYLILKDPYFLNYTNLSLSNSPKKQLVYVNNLNSNSLTFGEKNLCFLSKPIPEYQSDLILDMGDLVVKDDLVFEVIDVPITEEPIPNPDPLQLNWEIAKKTQYITKNDLSSTQKWIFRFQGQNSPEKAGNTVRFKVKNIFGEVIELGMQNIPGEAIPIEKASYPKDPNEPLIHDLDLSRLPEGQYTITLEDDVIEDGSFYRIPPKVNDTLFGVIELYHLPPNLNDTDPQLPEKNAFIDTGDDPENPLSKPKGQTYHLHFKNRLTFWRYIFRNKSEVTETRPRPLSKKITLLDQSKLKLPDGVEVGPLRLPNAEIFTLTKKEEEVETDNNQKLKRIKYLSNIHVFANLKTNN